MRQGRTQIPGKEAGSDQLKPVLSPAQWNDIKQNDAGQKGGKNAGNRAFGFFSHILVSLCLFGLISGKNRWMSGLTELQKPEITIWNHNTSESRSQKEDGFEIRKTLTGMRTRGLFWRKPNLLQRQTVTTVWKKRAITEGSRHIIRKMEKKINAIRVQKMV